MWNKKIRFEANKEDENQRLTDLYTKYGVEIASTPIPIICGSLNNIYGAHVLLDQHLYPFDCLIKAVQFAFQVYEILKIDFPPMRRHLWSFIQRHFYNLQ